MMEPEKVILRRDDSGHYCLHTEDGVPLANQASVHFHQAPGELARVTVEFYCDGDNVSLADVPPEQE